MKRSLGAEVLVLDNDDDNDNNEDSGSSSSSSIDVEFDSSDKEEEEEEEIVNDDDGDEDNNNENHQSKKEEMLTMFVKKPSLSKQLRCVIQNAERGRTISRSSRYSKHHKLYSSNGKYDSDNDDDVEEDDEAVLSAISDQPFIHVTRKKEPMDIEDISLPPETSLQQEKETHKEPSRISLSPCLEFDKVCMDALEAPLAAELRKLGDFVSEACCGTRAFPLVPVAVVSTGLGASDYEFMMDRVGAAVGARCGALVEVNLPLYSTPKDLVKFAAQRVEGTTSVAFLLRNVEGCRTAAAAVGALVSLLYETRQRCSAVVVLGVSHAAGLDLEPFLEHAPAAALAFPRSFALSSATDVMDAITRRVLAQWSTLPNSAAKAPPSAVGPNLLRYALRFYFERSGSITNFVTHLRQGLQLASRTAATNTASADSDAPPSSSSLMEKKARRKLRMFAMLFRLFCHFCSPRDNTTQVLYRTLNYGRTGGVKDAAEAVKLAQARTSDRAHSGDPLAKAWLRTEGVKATRLVALLHATSVRDGRVLPNIPLDAWAAEVEASLKSYAAAKGMTTAPEISQVTVGELLTREVSEQLAGGSLRLLSSSSSSSSNGGGNSEVRRKKWNLTSSADGKPQQQQGQQRIRALFFEVFQPLFLIGDDALLATLPPTPGFLYANDVRGLRCCCGEDVQVSILKTLTSPPQMDFEDDEDKKDDKGVRKRHDENDADTSPEMKREEIADLAKRCFAVIASKNKATVAELQEIAEEGDPARTDAALDLLLQLGLVYASKAAKNITVKPSFPFSMK